jgi:hypothetical protein
MTMGMTGGGLRRLDPSIIRLNATAATPECGAAPMLQWVKIEDLVVDDRYQRPIVGAGLSNVGRIVRGFRWSKFAPVIVAPVAGGQFAIIDGQHRATAAAILGFESVPAQIVTADSVEQADAFRAVNGQVTRVNALTLHHAAITAGDARAREVQAVASAAGVTILRSPKRSDEMAPGETIALGSITRNLGAYGQAVVGAALSCVTRTANNRGGMLSAAVIRALCAMLGAHQKLVADRAALLKRFDGIDIEAELEEATFARRPKMTAIWEVLRDRLEVQLGLKRPEPSPLTTVAAPDPAHKGAPPTLAEQVAALRTRRTPWAHVARITGKPEISLRRAFDPEFVEA